MKTIINRRQFARSSLKIMGISCLLIFIRKNKLFACDPCGSSTSTGTASNGTLINGKIIYGNSIITHYPTKSYGNDAINSAISAAADSAFAYGFGKLGITNVSLDGGGPFGDHTTHQNGTCYDCINFGKNGYNDDIDSFEYSRNANYNFLSWVNAQIPIAQVVSADSTLINWLQNDGINGYWDQSGNHRTHMHVQTEKPCY